MLRIPKVAIGFGDLRFVSLSLESCEPLGFLVTIGGQVCRFTADAESRTNPRDDKSKVFHSSRYYCNLCQSNRVTARVLLTVPAELAGRLTP
jgi:hypothetical protein